MNIRQARTEDVSRIAEIFVTNYLNNFYPIFKSDEFYFGELNVLDTAKEYLENPELLANTYVYDDGVIRGFIRLLKFALEEKGAKWLWVLQQNERGAAFYKRYGFDFTGEKFMEDGWIPLLKMSV